MIAQVNAYPHTGRKTYFHIIYFLRRKLMVKADDAPKKALSIREKDNFENILGKILMFITPMPKPHRDCTVEPAVIVMKTRSIFIVYNCNFPLNLLMPDEWLLTIRF